MKLPATVSGTSPELTLSEVSEIVLEGNGRFLIPEEHFIDKISKDEDPYRCLNFLIENLNGAMGTESEAESVKSKPKGYLGQGYRVPPDEDLFKFRYRISYLANYPYQRPDFEIFATGRVSADGTTIEITDFNKRMGISELKIGTPVPNPDSDWNRGSHTFSMEVVRNYGNAAEEAAINRFFGDWKETTAAVFVGNETTSTGALEANSWGFSHLGGKGSYEWGAHWIGDLLPGMELHFGLMAKKPDAEVEFVVDRASLAPK